MGSGNPRRRTDAGCDIDDRRRASGISTMTPTPVLPSLEYGEKNVWSVILDTIIMDINSKYNYTVHPE